MEGASDGVHRRPVAVKASRSTHPAPPSSEERLAKRADLEQRASKQGGRKSLRFQQRPPGSNFDLLVADCDGGERPQGRYGCIHFGWDEAKGTHE
ncbi:hypothetical protein HPB50_013120 [Hyalomma asiaticum]|uniref:Uncharacterized protein n=1 Tax=Hyalomma asiaticum TaxID=266040 RepID=A0ACB7S9M1_HYAAI|nr:hypothetical protein HPB50_013120 [Hyalomma asiaticum]